jgi:hypothetical protein
MMKSLHGYTYLFIWPPSPCAASGSGVRYAEANQAGPVRREPEAGEQPVQYHDRPPALSPVKEQTLFTPLQTAVPLYVSFLWVD